ncbi:MAG: hypothetical protein U9Q15_02505 [Patescibacteria group bacterium]|nr:hypothetical protein [Patescibacteria group bacterium]
MINKDGKYCLYDTEDIQHSCVSYRTATENISWTRNPLTNRFRKERTSPERKEFLSEDFIECQVDRVIDGDTFICSNNEQ